MARIYPLFSSSKGNSIFIGSAQGGVLIDAGVSFRRLSLALTRCRLSPEAVRAVFITHDHADHVSGIRVLAKKTGVPVYAQPKTAQNLAERGLIEETADLRVISGTVTESGYAVTPFATSHDTEQSCGYRVACPDGRVCAVCTDLGYVSETVESAVQGSDLVLLESNYDETMLRCGSYPHELKNRIASRYGHLSNRQSAEFARRLVQTGTAHFVLGHLSQENNTPAHALKTYSEEMQGFVCGRDYLLSVAAPETDGGMIAF